MSFRPTIAVRFGSEIADIGYYRNWSEESLMIEAAAIAAAYDDCRSLEEYRDRAFGRQEISYVIDPEKIPNTQENLRWLESCSEMPVSVDLKSRCIYVGTDAIPPDAISFGSIDLDGIRDKLQTLRRLNEQAAAAGKGRRREPS